MATQGFPLNTVLDTCRQVQFGMTDLIRRAQGDAFGALGLNPIESPYRVIFSGPFWRLRDYGEHDATQSLLIVAAPIKRPYIWDLVPSTSAIRYILRQGLRVHLLEWLPASQATGKNGLTEYAKAISECVARILKQWRRREAIPDGSFTWRHARRHIRGVGDGIHTRPCAAWCTPVLPARD